MEWACKGTGRIDNDDDYTQYDDDDYDDYDDDDDDDNVQFDVDQNQSDLAGKRLLGGKRIGKLCSTKYQPPSHHHCDYHDACYDYC